MAYEGAPRILTPEQKEVLHAQAKQIFDEAISHNVQTGVLHVGNMSKLFKDAVITLGLAKNREAAQFADLLDNGDVILGELNLLLIQYNKNNVLTRSVGETPDPSSEEAIQLQKNSSAQREAIMGIPVPTHEPVRPFTEVDQPELEGFEGGKD